MLSEVKNLEILSAISKKSKEFGNVHKRKSACFNIRISGSVEYQFKDKTLVVKQGEMIFIPEGSSYTWRVTSKEESYCLIIYLNGEIHADTSAVYSLDNFIHSDYLFNNYVDLWNFGNIGERCQCYSYIYELFSYVFNQENFKYKDNAKFSLIEPAVKYLKKHIYDTSLKIDKLHNLCGLSHTYFRKIFIKEIGMNPKDYVVEKRLSHAKVIIEMGEMDSVKQLAFSVGYDDPLYFSKAFKKKYGISPAKMNSI